MTPAQASCESPPSTSARFDALVTAFRNRTRSATYPRQSSKSQLMPYLPSANRARAAATPTPRPPTPNAPRSGPLGTASSSSHAVHARRAARQDVYKPGGACVFAASNASAAFSTSGDFPFITGEACAKACQATPASRDARASAATQRVCSAPSTYASSRLRYASRSEARRRNAASSAEPAQRAGAGCVFCENVVVKFAKTFPAGLALGSVRATSRVSITTNEMTSPKCTVRLYANGPFCLSDQFPTFVGSRVGNHSWYARIAARSRVAYAPSRSGWWFSPPFVHGLLAISWSSHIAITGAAACSRRNASSLRYSACRAR